MSCLCKLLSMDRLDVYKRQVLNSTKTSVRNELFSQANLVSAVRLPNNLFTDNAGTEVVSYTHLDRCHGGMCRSEVYRERQRHQASRIDVYKRQ